MAKKNIGKSRGSSSYRLVQKILSDYIKKNNIKLGKEFNTYASKLYKATKGSNIKYIGQNIDQLYHLHVQKREIVREFPDNFPYYQFTSNIMLPEFEDVSVSLSLEDGESSFYVKGSADEVLDYYRENMHRYLRVYYNASPVAYFHIKATDGKAFVDYEVIIGVVPVDEVIKVEVPKKDEVSGEGKKKAEVSKFEVDRAKEIRGLIADLRQDLKDGLISKKFYQSEVAKLTSKLEEGGNI